MSETSTLTTPSAKQDLSVYHRLLMSKPTQLTRMAYSHDLRHFADFLGFTTTDGRHPLELVPNQPEMWRKFDPALVAAYLEHLKTTVSDKTGRTYKTATIARRLTVVKELLTEATYLGLYPGNQLAYVKDRIGIPEVTSEHHGGLTPDEQAALFNVASEQPGLKGIRDFTLFRLWLDTGVRRSELASLKVRDLTVKDGIDTIVVREGKGNRLREIGVESYTAYIVRYWLEASSQDQDPNRPIFCQVRKFGRAEKAVYKVVNPEKHLRGDALYKLVKWYCRQAGILSKVVPHSFRVALITDTIKGGAKLPHIQKVTGHTTTRMITEVYDRNIYADPVARYRQTPLPTWFRTEDFKEAEEVYE